MERVFILGLGLAGQITAASIVIAAKGLIRFPELQSAKDDTTSVKGDGIDEVTEYFLGRQLRQLAGRPGVVGADPLLTPS